MVSSLEKSDVSLLNKANLLARQARMAAAVFSQYDQIQVDYIVKAMTIAAIEAAPLLAKAAHSETRMGIVEDKILKNLVASEFLYNQVKDKPTVGIIKVFPEDNIVEVAEPVGVILALAPVTNPTSTVIFKSIACAKTRNSVIFSPHLMAADSSNLAAKILYEAALKAGAPKGFISWIEKSPRLRRQTELLMVHPDVDLIFATGGTQMVKAAHSSGKPALGVGAGNTPVYVHKSAHIEATANDIIMSKTFDNGTECPSEQTLIIDRTIGDKLINEFQRLGCHVCSNDETSMLSNVVVDECSKGMNYKLVGQSAYFIASQAGFNVPPSTKVLLCELVGNIQQHKLIVEKLMPVLGYLMVDTINDGINRSLDVNYAGGTGHTAGIFADDESVIELFSNSINAGRIIVNSPTSIGGLGGLYNNLNTTLSFGCGTGGGNITTDNVGIKNLLNIKRVPRRKNFTVSFKTTKQIYSNPGSLAFLKELAIKKPFIIASKNAAKRGHISQIIEKLPAHVLPVIYDEIGVEPDWSTVEKALAKLNNSQADSIIAIGGGSVIDLAKIVRLFYDHPNLSLSELSISFLDFRHRMCEFPKELSTKLIAVPTTSGTGAEVTPFAVLKDNQRSIKVSLIDETLLPDIAIIDANLTTGLSREVTLDTAFDALTHAFEALVSTFSSDYTDGLALESMRLILESLPKVLIDPTNILYRHKLHNAACLAGMAIGNASVGINHAMAHSLGAMFNIPHGRANSVFLLSTINYNSKIPNKFMSQSSYPFWIADQKYARAYEFLGLVEELKTKVPFESLTNTFKGRQKLILSLQQTIYDFGRSCEQPLSVSELGINFADYERSLPSLVENTFLDMSLKTNPSYPLMKDIYEILMQAYPYRKRPE